MKITSYFRCKKCNHQIKVDGEMYEYKSPCPLCKGEMKLDGVERMTGITSSADIR